MQGLPTTDLDGFEQGRLKFEAPKKMMKIDGHPFATNMVDVVRDEGSPQAKILTSSRDLGLLILKRR